MTKRLYRSGREKMLGGVAGGIAEYFEIDVTLVRLIWLITLMPGGVGFLGYILAWIIIPVNPEDRGYDHRAEYSRGGDFSSLDDDAGTEQHIVEFDDEERQSHREKSRQLAGIILIGLGAVFLLNQLLPWFRWSKLWPLVLIAIGLLILLRGHDGRKKG